MATLRGRGLGNYQKKSSTIKAPRKRNISNNQEKQKKYHTTDTGKKNRAHVVSLKLSALPYSWKNMPNCVPCTHRECDLVGTQGRQRGQTLQLFTRVVQGAGFEIWWSLVSLPSVGILNEFMFCLLYLFIYSVPNQHCSAKYIRHLN